MEHAMVNGSTWFCFVAQLVTKQLFFFLMSFAGKGYRINYFLIAATYS